MSKLRVGLIGCGGRGRAHAEGYAASKQAEMVACSDPNPTAAQAMSKDFGVPKRYEDYHEMLEKEEFDAVSICLWPAMHLEATLAAVDAGGIKLINAEKPMAPTWGESTRMHEACENAGIMMTFSHQRRFGAAFVKARQLLKDGEIGELYRMEGYCSNLFDWGTHWFDMLFFYNDQVPVEWVMGQVDVVEDVSIFGAFMETNGLSYFRYANGVSGMLVTGADHGGRCANRIMGTDGIIEVTAPGAPLRIQCKGSAGWEVPDLKGVVPPGGDTVLYILDSIDALLKGREPELSSRKSLMATELIFASYESARRRARVYLPLDIEDSPLLTMLETGDITMPDYPARLVPEERADGFELLFNGKDLSGWKTVGTAQAWGVVKGLLTCNGEGHGWIRPESAYTDFVLRLDYRLGPRGNSGVFLRTSEEGRPAYQGMEIQLLDDRLGSVSNKCTGAIYDAVAPKEIACRYTGSWNAMEVSCKGSTVRVVLNNREVQNCDVSTVPELKGRLKSGLVGLQNHGTPVEFRNVRIKAL